MSAATNALKSRCPVTLEQFRETARPVEITIGGVPMTAEVKEFSTGSLGWYLSGKVAGVVGGQKVETQIGINMIIIGSKGMAN